MEDKILISSGWCRVRPHHKLTDQSESISHDLVPFWPAETLFNAVSTKICSHLFRYGFRSTRQFHVLWRYTSTGNVMPHLLVPGIRCPVSSLEHFKTLTFGHNTVILPVEGRRLVADF